MLNNSDTILHRLHQLGLAYDEARIYIELLKEPSTHLRLARATGINRTKIYRLIEELEKRSLVTKRTDDRGTFLVAADPSTLEVELVTKEEHLKRQRTILNHVLPTLKDIGGHDHKTFVVHTYEGVNGFKQMLWHELKTKGEAVIFGSGTISDLVDDARWAEKHRSMTIEAGYRLREVLNPGEKEKPYTFHQKFMDRFTHRIIAKEILNLENQTIIYNNTVATYHWRQNEKVGFEIINKDYANMMRQMFETFWQLAAPAHKPSVLTKGKKHK